MIFAASSVLEVGVTVASFFAPGVVARVLQLDDSGGSRRLAFFASWLMVFFAAVCCMATLQLIRRNPNGELLAIIYGGIFIGMGVAFFLQFHETQLLVMDTMSMGQDGVAAAAIAAVRAMEATIEESGLDWLVLRGGLFYGPGTGFDDDWFARARAAKLRLPEEGADYVSLVHIADMAAATVAAIRCWPSHQALIVADDRPAPWRDVFAYICALAGSNPPKPGGRALMPSFRVTNRLARELLSWSPSYADYRVGLVR